MTGRMFYCRHAMAAALIWALCATLTYAIDVDWDNGGVTNNWTDGDNWDPDTAGGPMNDQFVDFDVTIGIAPTPLNVTVVYDRTGESEITGLTLGSGSQLNILLNTSLTVLEEAILLGTINAVGGDFTATGTGTVFPTDPPDTGGSRARVLVSNGSNVTIGGDTTTYASTQLSHGTNFFNVNGAGSQLNLTSLEELDVRINLSGAAWHQVLATGNGQLNMPDLQTIHGPLADERLFVTVSSGGGMDLSSLEEILISPGTTSGHTVITANAAPLSMPALTTAQQVVFDVDGGGVVDVNALVNYSSVGLNHGTNFFDVNGAGSQLNMTSLEELDVRINLSGAAWHQILATNNGKLDLSLQTIHGPLGDERLFITVSSGGGMDLSSLEEILISPGTTSGHTVITANAAPLSMPALTTAQQVVFDVDGGSVVDVNALANYSSVGLNHGINFFDVNGSGSQLNMTSLEELDVRINLNGAAWHQILATNNGKLDLSNLQTIHGPLGDERLFITVSSGGGMDLSSLEEILISPGTTSGHTVITANAAPLSMPALTTAQQVVFDVDGGGVVDVNALVNYSSVGLNHGTNFFDVNGSGSQLNMTSLEELDVRINLNGAAWHQILATNNGKLDLSNLQTIHGPLADERLFITVSSGGGMDLSSLEEILISPGTTSGHTVITANAAPLSMPALTTAQQVVFDVDGGGVVDVNALANYSSVGLNHGINFFDVNGAGSQLNMTSLEELDVQIDLPGAAWHQILATNNGQLDLSNLQTIRSPLADERLFVTVSSGGGMDLSSLEEILISPGTTSGHTVITANAAPLSMPALTTAQQVVFDVDGGGVVDVNALANYSSVGLNHGTNFFDVNGAGSQLNMTSLEELDVRINLNGAAWHQILATNNGKLDLSNLQTIHGPLADERLFITVSSGGGMDLSSLEEILISPGTTSGHTVITANAAPLSMPALTTAQQVVFDVDGGGVVDVNALVNYSSVGLNHGINFFDVNGAGSQLNMTSLEELDVRINLNGAAWHQILATNNGQLDLSNLQTIHGPLADERLFITVSSGGGMDLSSLEEILISPGTTSGHTVITANAAPLSMPALTTAQQVVFDVDGGSVVDVNALANYSSVGLNHGINFFDVNGSGSQLNMTSLEELDVRINLNGAAWHQILAANNGQLNMPNLQTIQGPLADERLFVTASSGSNISMESLAEITSGANGRVIFTLSTGATIRTGDLNVKAPNTEFILSGGSTLHLGGLIATNGGSATVSLTNTADLLDVDGSLILGTNISVNATAGTTVTITGNLSYQHTGEDAEDNVLLDETIVQFDGSGIQELEIGDSDFDIGFQSVFEDNFGIGQLIVGQDGQATIVQLVDQFDNGNRNGGDPEAEALYLFGLGEGDESEKEDGLRILGGSTLVIDEFNVYALIGGQRTRIMDLFGPDQDIIPFDQGFIAKVVPEPATGLVLIVLGCPFILRRRGAKGTQSGR